ncbi:hypothetical protein EIN_154240 [Entamoeba invadens IP1]|uniref:Uncharacterized protein n=1 Tax=Entamoeba invadens IP1 TaxID=370355 RepID=A0A0A1U962_ENTIV|nr:hypothetical protein EIN_154240 [Entamoeba invadens IP1]ELP91367.1 hypothetical protein EIN_154240 [Entamoeba invadens IP1]|eukprot:XP_004258138.1 hypothetical protein EIN_154240 [Entamoeba invadens IP1]
MLFFILYATAVYSYDCIYSQIQAQTEETLYTLDDTLKQQFKAEGEWTPLIVKFDMGALDGIYTSNPAVCLTEGGGCSKENVLTTEKKDYIKSMVESVQNYLNKYFQVHPGTIQILQDNYKKRVSCGEVSDIKDQVVDSDVGMIMYVTSHPVESPTILAYAASCGSADDYLGLNNGRMKKRSIFGYTNINPANLDTTPGKFRINVHTFLHETLHALGFSSSTGTRKVSKGKGEETVSVIDTPNVLRVAKDYFNDQTIEYVEFEDGGGSGTAGAHWEKRVLYNEIMTGTSSMYSSLSNFTLAYFEDLGTFKPNYSVAEPLTWGKGMKKDFFKCSNWPEKAPYYGKNQNRGCTPDRGAVGICDATTHTSPGLDPIYQNYGDPNRGGMVELMDYCIHTTLVSGGQCYAQDMLSLETVSSLSFLDRGSSFGQDARCFTTSLMKYSVPIPDFSCYRVKCVERGYRVRVNNNWMLCSGEEELSVAGYAGKITCVNKDEFCNGEVEEWPDIWKLTPAKVKSGNEVSLIGKYLKDVYKVYVSSTEQTIISTTDQELVFKLEFTDAVVNIIELLQNGYVTVEVKVVSGEDVNAVYQGFQVEMDLKEVANNFGQWLYKNIFFTVGIVIIFLFIVNLFIYIIAKRIVYRRAKQIARNLI